MKGCCIKSLGRKLFPRQKWIACPSSKNCMNTVVVPASRPGNAKSPGTTAPGPPTKGLNDCSVAAIDQTPTGSPWGRDQAPYITAAIAIIRRATHEEAGTAPAPAAAVPAAMPTVAAKGRGGGRRQCGRRKRGRGNCNKREFAKHDGLLQFGAISAISDARQRPLNQSGVGSMEQAYG